VAGRWRVDLGEVVVVVVGWLMEEIAQNAKKK
jgi:hypothetical protein